MLKHNVQAFWKKRLFHFVGASSLTSGEKGNLKSVNSSNGRGNKAFHLRIASSEVDQRHDVIWKITLDSFSDTRKNLFDKPWLTTRLGIYSRILLIFLLV